MDNRIRQFREKKGWSQRDLAAAIGTSQQQIARIETGSQSVKLDLALAISAALKTDLGKLFPGARTLLGRGKHRKDRAALIKMHYDSKALKEFDEAGVDLDPATWILQVRLRGGAELSFVISAAEASRFRRNVQEHDPGTPFIVFHSAVVAVALNRQHLLHYHELWDAHTPDDWHDSRVPRDEVAVCFTDSPSFLVFDVDVDEGHPGDEDDDGQMRGLLSTLETFIEPDEFIWFRDADGEDAFFRAADITCLTVPLRVLDARLNDSLIEAEELIDVDESREVPTNTAPSEVTTKAQS